MFGDTKAASLALQLQLARISVDGDDFLGHVASSLKAITRRREDAKGFVLLLRVFAPSREKSSTAKTSTPAHREPLPARKADIPPRHTSPGSVPSATHTAHRTDSRHRSDSGSTQIPP